MARNQYTKEDIRRTVFDEEVRFVRLQFVDIFGTLKNVAITVEQLEMALAGEIMFDGSSIEGMYRLEEADMYLIPDLSTFEIFPWRPHQGKVARLICDIYKADGTPFEGDPRSVLKRVIGEAEAKGYHLKVGSEFEFFLFHTDENGDPTTTTHDKAGYFDLGPIDLGENVRRDILLTLEEMGFNIGASHHEVAPGQHEIDFMAEDILRAADDIVTFKLVVKVIAQKHGLHATFMPKPLSHVSGSGMHTNLTIVDESGKNLFYDAENEWNTSALCRQFMAGMLQHAKAVTAVTNPTINSYKRLVTGHEAPNEIGWSKTNTSPLIRIPTSKNNKTFVEYRSPDPSCNPYLALAAMLKAGLSGISEQLELQEPMNKMSSKSEQRALEHENFLPKTLKDALLELEADEVIKDSLKGVYANYQRAKKAEWNEYLEIVHPWEVNKYISRY